MKIKSLLFASILLCVNAFGASTTNMVDQWGVASESGWGLSIQQQASTLFINMFVYDQAGQPTWFIGAATPGVPSALGRTTFGGAWYKVNGTFYGSPWNASAAQINQVGVISFDVDPDGTEANLSYSVNGVTVNKRVQRELWSYENYNGQYIGGIIEDTRDCALAGHREIGGIVTITQTNNTAMSMTIAQQDGGACSYAGTYSQLGHMGSFVGGYSCTDGTVGTFTAFEMETSISGMTGRFVAQSNGCSVSGHFGGLARFY